MNAGTDHLHQPANANPPVENAWETVELPRSLFVAGDNVLAAEVHQVTANSSDLSWAAELIVCRNHRAGRVLVDSVTFGPQTTDVSFGRNATNGWSSFGTPTPEEPNVTEPLTDLTLAPPCQRSLASGFYTNAQSVSLSSTGTVTAIRYTLDGSVPGPASPVYSNALAIATNAIFRARAFVTGWIPGPILTRSYLVDEPADRTLPVMSFVVDPATLFDSIIGIYTNTTPTSYPHKGREVPVRGGIF